MSKRGFTLMELLASLAVISIIATITTVSYSRVIEGNKMSSAINGTSDIFKISRAYAISNSKYVLVSFRPVLIKGGNSQQIEITASELNNTYVYKRYDDYEIMDQYLPIGGISSFKLPEGTSVAYAPYVGGPNEEGDTDDVGGDFDRASNRYLTGLSYLPSLRSVVPDQLNEFTEGAGQFGLLFDPNGKLVTLNMETGAIRLYVDYDFDGKQDVDINSDNSTEATNEPCLYPLSINELRSNPDQYCDFQVAFFDQKNPWDECYIQQRLSFAIYDDSKLRDKVNPLQWTSASGNNADGFNQRIRDHTSFVVENGIFFNFNRFTGELLE